jgi:hypothetical protein
MRPGDVAQGLSVCLACTRSCVRSQYHRKKKKSTNDQNRHFLKKEIQMTHKCFGVKMLNIINHQVKANQSYNEIPSHSIKMPTIKTNKK